MFNEKENESIHKGIQGSSGKIGHGTGISEAARNLGVNANLLGRWKSEMALYDITEMHAANCDLKEKYLPAFNREFMETAREEGKAFVTWTGNNLDNILCEHYSRVVTGDNYVHFRNLHLQIPPDLYRCNYVKARVKVHLYNDASMAVFHGPRKLTVYEQNGMLVGDFQQLASSQQ